jgi:hypothetical protein
VATEFDLPLLQARLAKLRDYSEPFRVVDANPGAVARLMKSLRAAGLECASRGRYHYVGAIHREAAGRYLRGLYERAFGEVLTLAFVDHRSALWLLRQVDLPLVMRSGASDEAALLLADVPAARISVTDSVGAWASAILELAGAAQAKRW